MQSKERMKEPRAGRKEKNFAKNKITFKSNSINLK
jgi:hypothetical protein